MFWMVIVASSVTGVGLLRQVGASDLRLESPVWAPSVRLAEWLSILTLAGAAAGMALAVATGKRPGLIGGLWVGTLLLHWVWVRMLLKPRLSASFTMHNVAWVATFLSCGAAWASVPLSGYLSIPLLVWLTFAGAVTFVLWQINQPSQRR